MSTNGISQCQCLNGFFGTQCELSKKKKRLKNNDIEYFCFFFYS
jgi:hypothetical protein